MEEKERAEMAAKKAAAVPNIDAEASAISLNVLAKALSLSHAREMWRNHRAEIEAEEMPEAYACALQEAVDGGRLPACFAE
jgi:hypothetical protein